MPGFDNDAIALVTRGLRYDSGSFPERVVSAGYIGDITTSPTAFNLWLGWLQPFLAMFRRRCRRAA